MQKGLMDPRGRGLVQDARRYAAWATGIPAFAALMWAWVVWVVFWGEADRLTLVPLAILFVVGVCLVAEEPWRSGESQDR
jgi:hypothetical protein